MLKAIDVANFFIDIANANPDNDEGMTNLRINKLVYFAQVWNLIYNKKPLFDEDIQAWKHGPVIPSVYYAFQRYDADKIPEPYGDYSIDKFSSEEIDLLIDIINNYDQYSSWKLADITHVKGGPWDSVYVEGVLNIPITNQSMIDYYSKEKLNRFELRYGPDDAIGTRDSDNCLVLPKELEDDSE